MVKVERRSRILLITWHRFNLIDNQKEFPRAGYIAMIEGILHEKLKPILGKKSKGFRLFYKLSSIIYVY